MGSHLWLCHVDVAAQAVIALASAGCLVNETHHVEHARRDLIADFITTARGVGDSVRTGDFGAFLERLRAATAEPPMDGAVSEIMELFGIHRGISPHPRARRLEVITDRTRDFLTRLGVSWPDMPPEGQAAMVTAAGRLFA